MRKRYGMQLKQLISSLFKQVIDGEKWQWMEKGNQSEVDAVNQLPSQRDEKSLETTLSINP